VRSCIGRRSQRGLKTGEEGVRQPPCKRKKRTAARELCAAQKWRKEGSPCSYSEREMRWAQGGGGAAPRACGTRRRPAALQV
jgi:hypothetical protein